MDNRTIDASIPCITLWEPWATLVSLGLKTIETRTHARFFCLNGKRIGIHAGKHIDTAGLNDLFRRGVVCSDINELIEMNMGHIICTARVIAVGTIPRTSYSEYAKCEINENIYGLFLRDVAPSGRIRADGRQGIWYYSPAKPAKQQNLELTVFSTT